MIEKSGINDPQISLRDSPELEDIREELGKVVIDQSLRLFKQESAIASITDQIGDLTMMMKEIQLAMGLSPDRSG